MDAAMKIEGADLTLDRWTCTEIRTDDDKVMRQAASDRDAIGLDEQVNALDGIETADEEQEGGYSQSGGGGAEGAGGRQDGWRNVHSGGNNRGLHAECGVRMRGLLTVQHQDSCGVSHDRSEHRQIEALAKRVPCQRVRVEHSVAREHPGNAEARCGAAGRADDRIPYAMDVHDFRAIGTPAAFKRATDGAYAMAREAIDPI